MQCFYGLNVRYLRIRRTNYEHCRFQSNRRRCRLHGRKPEFEFKLKLCTIGASFKMCVLELPSLHKMHVVLSSVIIQIEAVIRITMTYNWSLNIEQQADTIWGNCLKEEATIRHSEYEWNCASRATVSVSVLSPQHYIQFVLFLLRQCRSWRSKVFQNV